MRRLRQILISILVISMIFGCVGCGGKKDETKEAAGYPAIDGKYLVQDGASEYKIVIPKDADNLVTFAASEFNKFFEEATTLILPVVTEEEVSDGDRYISIGTTTQLEKAQIAYDTAELGKDGYRIVTKDENLYLVGGSDYGSLYAVYELLSYLVDYDFFAKDCYTVREGVTELPLCDMDLTDIPDIAARTAADGVVTSDNNTMYRMRVRPYLEDFISVNGSWAHNCLNYVANVEKPSSKWFNSTKTQLCYTAHGDEKEYKKMQEATFEALKNELIKDTTKNSVTFTMADNFDTCSCTACQKIVSEYGAISASVILYLNDMGKRVKEWFATEEGKPYARELKIMFFAYLGYEAPPATYNDKTGKWEANNGIKLEDNIYCYLAPINMDYYRSMNDKANIEYCNNMNAWTDIANGQLYLWYYSKNYTYYLAPYDCYDSIIDNYKWAVEKGAQYLFDLRQHDETGVVTGWSALMSYLDYKLAWDVDADVSQLINDFFEGYFGPAAEEMRNCFDELRTLTSYCKDNLEFGGTRSLYMELVKEEFWPKSILEGWLKACDRAEEKIAALKETSPEDYEMYHNHINGEKLSFVYLFVECYSYNTSEDIINAYKNEFKQIADAQHLSKLAEAKDISELYAKWGLN